MDLPVIDLAPYLEMSSTNGGDVMAEVRELCSVVSRSLREMGVLLVKDPRSSTEDNDQFLNMMERYFEQPDEFKRKQGRPELHYQVGVTPEGVEVPHSLIDLHLQEKIRMVQLEFRSSIPTTKDPKWCYMWRVCPRPKNTCFKKLNAAPMIPKGFPKWKETMDSWGSKMISIIEAIAKMATIGFNLPKCAFTSLIKQGPHLLGPIGRTLQLHGFKGIVFAGYHYDLNFLTVHGRSRFSGLNILFRNGHKVEVKVPVGRLLIKIGKQLKWLTGGECLAGMH